MSTKINITLLQYDIYWENPEANRASVEEMLSGIQTDVVILPEMFTTGFSVNAKQLAEPMGGHTFKWMSMLASSLNSAICGSIIIKENNKFYNRFVWVNPNGSTQYYNKRHLFRLSEEKDIFTSGDKTTIIEYKGWKFCPQICYDLRFPVYIRRTNIDYDVLLFSANWPASRNNVWKTLLPARAIENQCYSIGVNRIGTDGMGIEYVGNSSSFDFMGYEIKNANQGSTLTQITLDKILLNEFREKFPIHLDNDNFELK